MYFIENTFGSPELQKITGLHDGLLRQLRHRKYLVPKSSSGLVGYVTSDTTRALVFACLLQIKLPPRVSRDVAIRVDDYPVDDPIRAILSWAQLQRGAIFDPEKIAGRKLPIGEGELGTYTPPHRYWVVGVSRGKLKGTLENNLNRYFRVKRDLDGSVVIVFDLKWLARHFVKAAAGRPLWTAVK